MKNKFHSHEKVFHDTQLQDVFNGNDQETGDSGMLTHINACFFYL